MTVEQGFEQVRQFTDTPADHGGQGATAVAEGGEKLRGAKAAAALEDMGSTLDWRKEWYPVAFTKDVPEGVGAALACMHARCFLRRAHAS